MDIVTHAIVGAATGGAFGRPFAGAFFAVLPDLFLFSIKRRDTPTEAYNASHSLAACALVAVAAELCQPGLGWLALLAYWSHVGLDAATHGNVWAPMLFYPYRVRYSYGQEWEWFNSSWWYGLFLSTLWVLP